MSKKALYLLGIALTIILGTFLYQKSCCNCSMITPNSSTDKGTITYKEITPVAPFIISGNGLNYQCHDNLKFMKNSPIAITPLSDSVSIGIEKLKSFLNANPDHKVLITGYATAAEKNISAYPNLGFARANDVKNHFVSIGFLPDRIETNGVIKETFKMKSDTLFGSLEFRIYKKETILGQDWDALKSKINADPLILHFNSNRTDNVLNTKERQKISDILEYIKNVPDAAIKVVGHTDNTGDRDVNFFLGKNRADFVKKYLAKNGVDSKKIETSSKGPDEPISNNSTNEGKAKNRRTVITIK